MTSCSLSVIPLPHRSATDEFEIGYVGEELAERQDQ
ncbi:hypothetical protein SZ00_04007 [Rhodococcus sp. AD45]|nr:hypothetical protein SZ00_04007 [Rhodococcus sp. AD45]